MDILIDDTEDNVRKIESVIGGSIGFRPNKSGVLFRRYMCTGSEPLLGELHFIPQHQVGLFLAEGFVAFSRPQQLC